MYCIGVVTKNIEIINELSKNNRIIVLTKENVKEYLKQELDVLVIEEKLINDKYIQVLCNNSKYILIQDSISLNIKFTNKINVITFGFNHKSTVTISSQSDESTSICIQREIKGLNKETIDIQEISVENAKKSNINTIIISEIIEKILTK